MARAHVAGKIYSWFIANSHSRNLLLYKGIEANTWEDWSVWFEFEIVKRRGRQIQSIAITETVSKMVNKAVVLFVVSASFSWKAMAFQGGNTAFLPVGGRGSSYKNVRQLKTQHNCICIDCARVTNCAAYHFVETKHSQPHMTDNPVSFI
jgi:hypothetical protein